LVAEVVDLATGIRLERVGPDVIAPGQPVTFSVDAPATTLIEPVTGEFTLTWIQKNVLFSGAEPVTDPASPDIEDPGGIPPRLLFGASLTETVPTNESAGILHQVKGTIPIGTKITTPPQQVTVQWHVCKPLAGAAPPQCDPAVPPLAEGADYLRSDDNPLTSTFLFGPRQTEEFVLSSQVVGGVPAGAATEDLLVRATVDIALADGTTKTAQLHLPVKVAALALPTLVLMCTRRHFAHTGGPRRALLLLVPHESGLAGLVSATDESEVSHLASAQTIETTLDELRTSLLRVASISGGFAAYLLGLQRVVSLIRTYRSAAAKTYVRFRVADPQPTGDDGVADLSVIAVPSDTLEDTVSSVLLIGPPLRVAQLFNDRNFTGAELDLIARDQCYVAVGNLKAKQPLGDPSTGLADQQPTVDVVTEPGDDFENDFSSVRFSVATSAATGASREPLHVQSRGRGATPTRGSRSAVSRTPREMG
jgi:hypothetical protein